MKEIFPASVKWLRLLLAGFLILRLVFWLATFPNPDEAYYWLWGRHWSWSYYDHPGLNAWIQGLFWAGFGRSKLALRLPNLVSNLLLVYLYYRITIYLYGQHGRPLFGITVLLLLASPLYFLFLALAWPDHWLILLSLLSADQFVRFLDSYWVNGRGQSWRLYSAAIALGLAGLCKYNAVFVGLGFLATLLQDKRLRRLLSDYRLYMALALGLAVLSPILLWNLSHDFQSLQYYTSRSLVPEGRGLRWSEPLGFLVLSVLTFSPINLWALLRVLRHWHCLDQVTQRSLFGPWNDRGHDPPDVHGEDRPRSFYARVALWIFAISTGGLTAISLLSTALYYWNILAYLLLFPLLPAAFFVRSGAPTTTAPTNQPLIQCWRQRPLRIGQLYGLIFATLLVVHYSVLPLSVWVDRNADPDSRMLFGWEQVANAVEREVAQLGKEALRITTDYRSASALAYALDRADILALSDRVDQFDFWSRPAELAGRDAVILADDWHPATPALLRQFEHTSPPITLTIRHWGIWIKQYYLWRGYGFRPQPAGL
jgi:4-amino-4-deoxy-L-arabinose transferase-like glycosyltransferase